MYSKAKSTITFITESVIDQIAQARYRQQYAQEAMDQGARIPPRPSPQPSSLLYQGSNQDLDLNSPSPGMFSSHVYLYVLI